MNNQATGGEIRDALMDGVFAAMPTGGSERDVMTVITRPLWRVFLCVIGKPADSEPTEWQGMKTIRVCGSYTVVIDSEQFAAVSFSIRSFDPDSCGTSSCGTN